MKTSHVVRMDHGNGVSVEFDLDEIEMSDDQRQIVSKLFSKLYGREVKSTGDCTEGNCPAAEVLPKDEFEQIRSLRATVGTTESGRGLICDFCLDCVTLPQ